MFSLFYKYLILHKKAGIPGIGTFFIERKSAKLDFANKVFVSPELQVGFNPQTFDDKHLYTFISNEQKIDEAEAVTDYNTFANKLKENFHKHKSIELPGIGLLSQNAEGELFFTAIAVIKEYFPDAAAERISREHTQHKVLVGDVSRTNTEMKEMLVENLPQPIHSKDNWWIFAIALGIIGVATLVYYYTHHGKLH